MNHYLAIQEVRFGDMIQVSYELDQNLMGCRMLKLILQPIVENAIHHGRKENMEILRIRIELKREEDHMVFVISDNGIGMKKEQVEMVNTEIRSASEGFGLKNVAIRIQMQYGEKYGVKVKSELDVGTTIVIRLPIECA